MPSTTLAAAPTSPSASYDTLEKLLLCAEVVQNGETGQSFNVISSSLKENPLLTSSPNYDPGRLSGDTLRERWRDLVRDEGFGGGEEASGNSSSSGGSGSGAAAAATAAATGTPIRPRGSRVAMRNGMITSSSVTSNTPGNSNNNSANPLVNVPIGEKAVRDLTRRVWENYQNSMKEQIHSDERMIAQLLDEIGNLENERAREIEEMEAEEVKKREAAAAEKAAAEQAKAEAAAAAAATAPKASSPVAMKAPLPEPKRLDEPFVEQSATPQQQQATQLATLRTTPPSPSKASLQNILSDESSQPEKSVPLERQTSQDRMGYDPIRDGGRPKEGPSTMPETPQRYPPIQPNDPTQIGYQIYEKPPATIRRMSASSARPQPPEFGHIPSMSPGRPPLTPTGPRIGTFPQSAQRGSEMATSPIYPRHEHEQGYSNGHQSPISTLNLAHPTPRQTEEARTPRHIPPSFSPTTPSFPLPHSSPSRPNYSQLPPIHQLSPQRAPVQPPGYPAPMQRLPSQEYHPHHSPVSDHQSLHSPLGYTHSNSNVPHSPYQYQSPLTHSVQSPRTPGFTQPMPPPQYSPTHPPPHQPFYHGHIPHPQQSSPTPLQPAHNYQPSQTPQENRLPPINTPTQLAPLNLQYVTPKPGEPGRPSSPQRPRPEEISPVLAPGDDETGGVPDFPLEERTGRKRKATKGGSTKSEPVDEAEEHRQIRRGGSRQQSVDLPEEKTTKSSRGRGIRGASKPRGTAALARSRRGQSVSSVGSRTAEVDEMDVDTEMTAKEESVAPETIPEEPRKSTKKRPHTRRRFQEPSASTEPEIAGETGDNMVETPRDAPTPAEPATPRPSFHLDMSANATPTSASATLVKKFAQRANPLLNNVSAHRFANLFMKPVDERSAPGYSKIVYKPQDIKSIRASIKIGAAQNPTGTPTLTPTPTADAPSASFGTTPSTPTATSGGASSKSAITNSAQLEKEIWRMFANAVMYNKSNSPVAQEAKEMARDVGATIDNFRNAERIGERKAAEAAKEKEKEKEKEREISSGSSASAVGAGGRARRENLVKSEVLGDDESRKGDEEDDEEEDEDEEEEEEEQSVKGGSKKVKGTAKGKPAQRSSRRGKKDKEGDVEMDDKIGENEEEQASDSDKTAEDGDGEEEESERSEEEEEDDREEEEEEEPEQTKATKKSKAAAAANSRAKNTKTTRAAAADSKLWGYIAV
ncbi:hypothetical protein ABW20_dc0102764 [Dactylellina cionopaga]|nr:hypothetical protein ABW20_dc0102764 [Dactylellina cionopaga]